jgi:hypothetical protein
MERQRITSWSWKLAIPLLAVALVMAATAGEALAAIGISVGDTRLSANHSAITVPVTVSCSPFDPTLTVFTTEVSVTVEQGPNGRASGGVSAGYPGAMVVACNGTAQTVTVTATADSTASHLNPGPATISVFVRARAGIPCPDRPLCFGSVDTQSATLTTQSNIRLETGASGGAKEVGTRISLFGGATQTFPAGQPFNFSHGFFTSPTLDGSLGLWRFSLTLDGAEVKPSFIDMIEADDPVFGTVIHRVYVFNFPNGLTGTHVFGGTFEGPCEPMVAAGQATGPCPTPNAVVPATGFPVTTTVTFTS